MKVSDMHRMRWAVGDWTDDTDQMIIIMLSLLENNGEVREASVYYTPIKHLYFIPSKLGYKTANQISGLLD